MSDKKKTGVRTTVIHIGAYEECVALLDHRPVRKGELATVTKNDTDAPGSHMVVVHEPPGTMRDAMDIISELVRLSDDGLDRYDTPTRSVPGYSDDWVHEMYRLTNKAKAFLEGAS
jgi:hypothetical protein